MNRKLFNSSRHYQNALRKHLRQSPSVGLESARGVGSQALAAGLQTLDLAKLHEQTLIADLLPGCPAGGKFFCRGHHTDRENPL